MTNQTSPKPFKSQTYWLRGTMDPGCIAWAWFRTRPDGRIEYRALTGAASYETGNNNLGSPREEAAALYRKLVAQGWTPQTDAQAKAAGMDPRRLDLFIFG